MTGDGLLQLVFGLAALLGMGTGAVSLFVLRVEHNAERRQIAQLEARVQSLEARRR